MNELPRLAPTEVTRRMRSHDALLVCAYDSPVSFPKFPLPGAIPGSTGMLIPSTPR